jgi:2-polyprenyl-3-methyl-5-hydroxy-6-metoxy-1,4-benzoquinol methylase
LATTADNWIDFWDGQHALGRDHFDWSARVFLDRAGRLVEPHPDDTVLDVGCGPGSLPALLSTRVKRIHCVDTSERYVTECRERFRRLPNVDVDRLDRKVYTDLTRLARGRYSLFICNSVVQYYRDPEDLPRLLESMRELASPGARFIVSDLPGTRRAALSAATQLIEGARHGRLSATADLFRLAFGEYRRTRAAKGVLAFSVGDLELLAGALRIDLTVSTDRLTINGGRLHLLGRF